MVNLLDLFTNGQFHIWVITYKYLTKSFLNSTHDQIITREVNFMIAYHLVANSTMSVSVIPESNWDLQSLFVIFVQFPVATISALDLPQLFNRFCMGLCN